MLVQNFIFRGEDAPSRCVISLGKVEIIIDLQGAVGRLALLPMHEEEAKEHHLRLRILVLVSHELKEVYHEMLQL
jgi:hypothetical protein